MKAYKGFNKDLSCMGFKFKEGVINKTPEANCVKNGFHCAENPLDCLSYYPNWNNSVYYIVKAAGDLDEDGTDSKISCTEMTLVKKLTLEEFVYESLAYMQRYPLRKWNYHVSEQEASNKDGFAIARGKHPKAAGTIGVVLGLVREEEKSSEIAEITAVIVDGVKIKDNTWYTLLDGRLVEEREGIK
jgi:hypothetical protein